jgi:flagellar biosynthetic protein FliR
MALTAFQHAWVLTLAMAMARLVGLMVFLPGLSHPAVPGRLRWLIAAGLALGAVVRQGPAVLPAAPQAVLLGLACELVLGLLVGLLAGLLVVAAQVGADQISQQVGVSLVGSYDASSQGASQAIGQLATLLAVVVFLASGAYRVALSGLLDAPIGMALGGPAGWLATLTAMLGEAFVLALRLAGPVLAVMLVISVAMGALQRSAPSMHVFSIGLVVRVMVGLPAMAAGLVGLVRLVEVFSAMLQRRLPTLRMG